VSRPSFGIAHHVLDEDGDVRPLKERIKGSISSLIEQHGGKRPSADEASE